MDMVLSLIWSPPQIVNLFMTVYSTSILLNVIVSLKPLIPDKKSVCLMTRAKLWTKASIYNRLNSNGQRIETKIWNYAPKLYPRPRLSLFVSSRIIMDDMKQEDYRVRSAEGVDDCDGLKFNQKLQQAASYNLAENMGGSFTRPFLSILNLK